MFGQWQQRQQLWAVCVEAFLIPINKRERERWSCSHCPLHSAFGVCALERQPATHIFHVRRCHRKRFTFSHVNVFRRCRHRHHRCPIDIVWTTLERLKWSKAHTHIARWTLETHRVNMHWRIPQMNNIDYTRIIRRGWPLDFSQVEILCLILNQSAFLNNSKMPTEERQRTESNKKRQNFIECLNSITIFSILFSVSTVRAARAHTCQLSAVARCEWAPWTKWNIISNQFQLNLTDWTHMWDQFEYTQMPTNQYTD